MHNARTSYIAGMPQLVYSGLSENWLLKTCGDLHWQQLAKMGGKDLPEFRDAEGNKAYPAFLAVRVRGAALESVGENDAFSVATQLTRTAGARHFSTHTLTTGDGAGGARLAEVSMLSTFICRQRDRDNRSVARAAFVAPAGAASPAEAVDMGRLAKRCRQGNWDSYFGLEQAKHRSSRAVAYLPCPYTDFNGADLLYFANFQAIVDRAEWQWQRFSEPPVIAQRDLYFHGNVNLGEELELSFSATAILPDGLAHWCEIRRAADGEKIADVLTRKRWRAR